MEEELKGGFERVGEGWKKSVRKDLKRIGLDGRRVKGRIGREWSRMEGEWEVIGRGDGRMEEKYEG